MSRRRAGPLEDAAKPRGAMVERRLLMIAGILALWSGAVVAKLFSLQVVHHREYARKARAKQEVTRILPAPRGTIFDRHGETLAMSLPSESVTVDPAKLPDIEVAADLLERVLHMGESGLADKLKQAAEKGRGYFVVKHSITPEEAASVRALPIDGIAIEDHSRREYPNGSLAAHVLGGVDFSEHGNAGVEKSMDDVLHGDPGEELLLTDVKRRGIEAHQAVPAKPGAAITLTIDERVQFVAERELAAAVQAKGATSGSVVALNPNTGDILALASYPTFDPNERPDRDGDPARENHATSVPFEPGSVFKVVTVTAALETTSLRPESVIDCGHGMIKLPGGRIVHEAHGGFGALSMADVLKHSSNIGAIRIGLTTGKQNLYDYVERFGFDQFTGLPLPGESRGMLAKLRTWSIGSLASISFGQEIGVTTVQLAQAVSVIANGGLLVHPRLVMKVNGQLTPPSQPKRVIQPETAFTMRKMMEGVVMPGGTAYPEARLVGYSVAGKTGSAQIVESKHYSHYYNSSFAGMAPLTNPAIVVVVTLNGTHGDLGYGGRAAAPVFNVVATEALRILEVPRDLPDDPSATAVAAVEKPPVPPVNAAASNEQETFTGDDDSLAAAPPAAGGGPRVPDFRGMTMRDVLQTALLKGLEVQPDGSGVARMQDPPAGAILRQGERIRVRFSR